jgi:hypothetical protein
MARTKKKRVRLREAAAVAPQQPAGFFSGFDGASWSHDRGDVWWPTLETRDELDSYSRTELLRKIRWLHANVGIFRGFINNAADLIGWLTPAAATTDAEWNKRATAAFEDRCGTAAAFDVRGKFDFWTAQPMLNRCSLKDGDLLTVLTESSTRAAMVGFYESHQIVSPKDPAGTWQDGILTDPLGRHLSYGIRDGRRDTVVPVSARDAIYYGEFDSPGHTRVVPKLAHAITTGMDITEIRALVKGGIKTSHLFGAVRQASSPTVPRSRQGLAGAPGYESRTRAGNTAAGEAATVTEKFEISNVWGGNQIPRLPSGEELKILHDSRPAQNQMDFMEILARDMSIGYGLDLEVTWQVAGLTGPSVRFVLDKADRWIRNRQANLENWCRRVWVYAIAKEIKAGRLPRPSDPRWWQVNFIPQRNLTIDRGRDLRGRMEAVAAGYDSEDNFCEEMFGTTATAVRRAHIYGTKEKMDICAEAGVPFEVAYPPKAGTAAIAPAEDPAPPAANDKEAQP